MLNKVNCEVLKKNPGYQLKRYQLIEIVRSVLKNPIYKDSLKSLLNSCQLTEQEVINAFLDYNLDIFAFDNNIYSNPAIRLVLHIHNLVQNSWHQIGQQTTLDFIIESKSSSLIDMGFGVPGSYVQYFLEHGGPQITLCDMSESAFHFSKILLEQWKKEWTAQVFFKNLDMNTGEFAGLYDLYLFLDSIEHIPNSKEYLKKHVNLSSENAKFIFSLPIGPIIPVHYISWDEPESAFTWLEACGLRIMNSKLILMNPSVDLFAEQYNFEYKALKILCGKK